MAAEDSLDFEFDADEKILRLMHTVVSCDSPSWYINPDFKLLFAERVNLESMYDACQLELAPTLPDVLNNTTPPPFSYFKSLPKPIDGVWAIYAVAMEQDG